MPSLYVWFDAIDLEKPYRVQYRYKDLDGNTQRGLERFGTQNEAEGFYANLPSGLKILSKRIFTLQKTIYLRYEYGF